MATQTDHSGGNFSAHRVAGAVVGAILLGYIALTVAQVMHVYLF